MYFFVAMKGALVTFASISFTHLSLQAHKVSLSIPMNLRPLSSIPTKFSETEQPIKAKFYVGPL